jgi:ribosome-interacting GTPase 1
VVADVEQVVLHEHLRTEKPSGWTDAQLMQFVVDIRKLTKPSLIAANKSDLPSASEGLRELKSKYEGLYAVVPISAVTKKGLEELRITLFENSRIIRVYSKEPGKQPEMETPFVLPQGSTVIDLAAMIHREFPGNLSFTTGMS